MTKFGFKVFWSDKLPTGVGFPPEIEKALENSQHYVLYFTESASKSKWVSKEWQLFLDSCHFCDEENRRMYILLDQKCDQKLIPGLLKSLNRPGTVDDLITDLVKFKLSDYDNAVSLLEQQKQKVLEAQNYYRYNRFWGPIAENRDVHIFTCGRDIKHDDDSSRGYGGRTNIDMWDYRAVLDITHFFASNYPNAKVTIEDPISKSHGQELTKVSLLADRIASLSNKLEDKDCIIIGSPDVNDFAEIAIAKIHQIAPYTEGRIKNKGFVLIKDKELTASSSYWEKEGDEQEGVVHLDKEKRDYYKNEPLSQDIAGKMYGILVVANNPFCSPGVRRKIIILSGFSGVATNGISKLLTNEKCLQEFFELDNEFTNIDGDIEALIGVKYTTDKNFQERDTRKIEDYGESITFEKLVEI